MTDKKLMQMALDALRLCTALPTWPSITPVIEALRARLSQCERCGEVNSAEIHTCTPQEPVAWGVPNTRPTEKAQFMMLLHSPDGCQYPEQLVPLYTSPPQQPEQEPVAWTVQGLITDFSRDFSAYQTKTYTVPLYTAPPQRQQRTYTLRKWQGLTDEDWIIGKRSADYIAGAEWAEAKLKEKNA